MKLNVEKLKIKLLKIQEENIVNSLNKKTVLNKNNKLEIDVFLDESRINNNGLAKFITSHVSKRGFEDTVEIKMICVKKQRNLESFIVIGNDVIRDLKPEEITNVLNRELDNILYNALGTAKRDYVPTKCA